MNVNYSKEQVKSMAYHLTQIARILGNVQLETLVAPIDIETTAAELSMAKFLKVMGDTDNPEEYTEKELEEQRLDEEYQEQKFELLCGHWTPWSKKQLPDILISKICKGTYLLKVYDFEQGIEYASVKLDSNDYGRIFFILMGEEIVLDYEGPDDWDDTAMLTFKRTTYIRKKD
ncbi:hypothetical protein [Dysgonomonas sp. ZJ709]|uniref:hypothetical protein n=1 Tax=Dysgonomonas sp. ZJ709 TaxID=2709797 RepID=UPI0013EC7260|nr:hypothetical protein [Dysgonomonas sp. ZJ709]